MCVRTIRIWLKNFPSLGYKMLFFFCIPRNLIFSIVSEYFIIGVHPCKWDLQKTFLGCAPYTPNFDIFFTFFTPVSILYPRLGKFWSQIQIARTYVFYFYARLHAQILTKFVSIVTDYLINISFKFHEDLRFRWGDIWLLVSMYAV